jgi:integrase
MPENRVIVWVQHFADRPYLMLQWHDPATGKRKSRSAETCNPVSAEKKRADLEYELNHGLYAEPSNMSWERFRGLFEAEYLPGVKPRTRRKIGIMLNWLERLCAPRSLRSITERTVSQFAAGLREQKGRCGNATMAPDTLKGYLNYLRLVLGWAVEQKLLPAVPTFPRVKVPAKHPRPVPAETVERLIARAKAEGNPQMATFLLCAWLAGLRLSEALELEREESDRWPWVDFARSKIVLPAGFVKAVKDQEVPLDAELRDALLALPNHGRKVFRFLNQKGEPPPSVTVSYWVTRLARRAGVKLSMQSLRRGFGSYYAARVPAQVLQKLMRHASIRTTMDYYANVDDAVVQAVLDRRRNSGRNTGASESAGADRTQAASRDGEGANGRGG